MLNYESNDNRVKHTYEADMNFSVKTNKEAYPRLLICLSRCATLEFPPMQ